ncbi:tectonin domain-containing protein [Ramlibacter sp. WS9]|uniref:tectonin domain-containing protein n=1 Tax=Ramlibacter sp. WS9 TaxID=1882741 RepID=UPI001305113A|nr:tectonin domain-containing protein [Ramlibacter sp. WS9]
MCAGRLRARINQTAAVVLLAGVLAPPASAQTVPGAPTAVTATPGNGSITLNWRAPASDGGSPILYHTLVCWSTAGNSAASPLGVHYTWTLGGMQNGLAYNCYVQAGNAVGRGPHSSDVTATPSAPVPPSFVQVGVGTSFSSASIGSANNYGGISSGQLAEWDGSRWAPGGIALSQVAYGSDGTRWGVTSAGVIYRSKAAALQPVPASWIVMPGGLKQIAYGNTANIWGVNADGYTYIWGGVEWHVVPGKFTSVSASADGTVFALDANESIWRWTEKQSWEQMSGALRTISVGSASNIWGVSAAGDVYQWNPATSAWVRPPVPAGKFVGVSAAADGSLLLVRNDGTLWKK